MATYTELVDEVLSWMNRDINVLGKTDADGYRRIKRFINFGIDKVYRDLRIVPLEHTLTYAAVTSGQVGENALTIPVDAIEFIQLRRQRQETEGNSDLYPYDIYSAKTDIRSFYERFGYYKGGDDFVYTRERGNLLVYPSFNENDVFELYYYRRLPEADARFDINATNAAISGRIIKSTDSRYPSTDDFSRDPDLQSYTLSSQDVDIVALDGFSVGDTVVGDLTANWLRDENEKLMLYAALVEAFDYLAEADMSQVYRGKLAEEIAMLNNEDKMRMAKGGVAQVRYNSGLIGYH